MIILHEIAFTGKRIALQEIAQSYHNLSRLGAAYGLSSRTELPWHLRQVKHMQLLTDRVTRT